MSTTATRSASVERSGRAGAGGYVERIVRSSGSNFFYAFLTLPRARRQAIFAVYAFCHEVDSSVDDAPDAREARRGIDLWRRDLERAFEGEDAGPVATRVVEASRRFSIPREPFLDLIDGVEMDLVPRRFESWDDLAGYCERVAGAVGRICIRIFGRSDEEAERYAIALGHALQLTNILRDLAPDAAQGRFYLPREDLEQFGLDEATVLDATCDGRLALLQYEADRAASYFDDAASIADRSGRELCAAEVMRVIYRRLLARVVGARFPLEPKVTRVPRHEKAALALYTWIRLRPRRSRRTGVDLPAGTQGRVGRA